MTATVNRESQTKLAKLLAKENIQVSIGNYHTAFFDVKNRILGLPLWNTDNKNVSDLLIGHEVGHALYTPEDAITRFQEMFPNIPFDIANIVEDVRIERLIRKNYPGLVFSFKEGYKHFIQTDLFEIANKDVSTLKFVDRLNLRAKIGNITNIPLNEDETVIYDRCVSAETYDEVLEICKDIIEMIKDEKKDNSQQSGIDSEQSMPSNDESNDESDEGDIEDESDEGKSADDKSKPKESNSLSDHSQHSADDESNDDTEKDEYPALTEELRSKTLSAAEENIKNLQDETITSHLANPPNIEYMMSRVVPIKEIMLERRVDLVRYNRVMTCPDVVADWNAFKSTTKCHIATLIKEFERRKAAYQYSRAARSTTGTIDVNRLHSYKFEDQIFKSVTRLADAKNHGMVFFIDYSGSMSGTISMVANQTLQLVAFCKAVGIPFEVYGFTSSYSTYGEVHESVALAPGRSINFSNTSVFELLNSAMKKTDFELACRELKAQFSYLRTDYSSPMMALGGKYEIMNGTPLNETIIIAHEIVRRFKARHNVQKMNTIFLTDGDGCGVQFHTNETAKEFERDPENKWNCGVTVPVFGTNIKFNRKERDIYAALIQNLKTSCDTTVIGFFIANYRSDYKNSCINALMYTKKQLMGWGEAVNAFNSMQKTAKKEKCLPIVGGFNYDIYFVFDSKNNLDISEEEEFMSDGFGKNLAESSSQNKLARDFTKFNTEKKVSRVFLNKFAEFIA